MTFFFKLERNTFLSNKFTIHNYFANFLHNTVVDPL